MHHSHRLHRARGLGFGFSFGFALGLRSGRESQGLCLCMHGHRESSVHLAHHLPVDGVSVCVLRVFVCSCAYVFVHMVLRFCV